MINVLIFPFLCLLFTAALSIVASRNNNIQSGLSLLGSGGAVLTSVLLIANVNEFGTLVLYIGNWPAPFGITFVADKFSAVMVLIANLLGFFCLIYSRIEIDSLCVRLGFYPLALVLLAGVNGALLTGDLFNLYVWFEVLLISSFSLLTLGSSKKQIKGALPYVAINLFASILFLSGIAALYGLTGSLNLAELSLRVAQLPAEGVILSVATFFILAFGIKAAIFPLFFWLPISYHTPSFTVSALFAGLLTKVAVYALIRIFTLVFFQNMESFQSIFMWIAGCTMVIGVLGAAGQSEIRKILSFHIVSQIGYMIMGLSFFTPLAIAGTLFFIVHNILVKSNLFLISGVIHRFTGTNELHLHGGLYRNTPFLAILFLASAFSLAGLPPLSGFWGKLILVAAAMEVRQYFLVGISLLVGLLTLFSMTKIWLATFWKPSPSSQPFLKLNLAGYLIPISALTILAFIPSLYPEPLIEFFRAAGEEIMTPETYIHAVLGQRKVP